MKKTSPSDLDMLPGYDFTRAVRGHYAGRFAQGYTVRVEKTDGSTEETRFIRLVPDLAAAFPTDEAVSAALREWLRANQPLGIFDDTPTVTRPQTGKTIGMKTQTLSAKDTGEGIKDILWKQKLIATTFLTMQHQMMK